MIDTLKNLLDKKTLNIFSIIIGLLFIVSGVGKAIDVVGFSNLIIQYGLGFFSLLAPLIIIFEILLGLSLVFLLNPKRDAIISVGMLAIFTILFSFAHFRYGVNDCGCFGAVQSTDFPPLVSFIRNIILILMAGAIWWAYPKVKLVVITNWKRYSIIAMMTIMIFLTGATIDAPLMSKRLRKPVQLVETTFQNQKIQNTAFNDYIKTSSDSTYLIFCFSYTCPYCLNSIENLRSFIKDSYIDSVIVFVTGEEKDRLIFEEIFSPDFPIIRISANEMNKITFTYPTAFYVENNIVKVVLPGQLAHPYIFKSYIKSPVSTQNFEVKKQDGD